MLTELALYSDRLFMGAVGVFVFAMVLHGAEYAVHRSAKAVLVGAGGPALDEHESHPEGTPVRSRSERLGRMGVALVVLGAVLLAASIVTRGLAAQRWPLGNMYEFTSAICLAAVVAWLVVLRRSPASRPVGLFVLLPVIILLFLGGTVLYAPAAPVMPALQSYWLVVHVTAVTIASGLLMVPGVASLLFLLRRSGRLTGVADRLPSADVLDRLAYRLTIIAFPLYTFAIIAGAIWAEAAWGRFWGWDPKETVAFVAWVIYAAYLHARATAGWRSGPAAWVNVAGFAAVIFNLFFINMVVAGLHSYAGLG
ncbi:c-type cytochrome biogenesis protein CcsB [Pseudonocardia sp.]|jgi:cytochrome c-type biogenesis protein CcsB|uniref:c-type cytochrome biogenesis protein CcsB n=1 Tax=Pseudonocardia sp. TaxID=60912 RepID=UPI002D89C128|nr:c-type cytochrome biogenesis protein CcsB [Pseudonocardia sp.]